MAGINRLINSHPSPSWWLDL